MERRIKNVEGLPTWFNLRNYRPLHEMGAAGWFYQISLRADSKEEAHHLVTPEFYVQHHEAAHTYLEFKAERNVGDLPKTPKNYWESTDLLPLIQEDPILSPARLGALDGFKRWMLTRSFAEIDVSNQTSARGVHAVTIEELYMNELTVVMRIRKAARQFFDETSTVLCGFMDEYRPEMIASSRIYNFLNRKAKARENGFSNEDYMGRPRASRYESWLSEPLQLHQTAQYPKSHSLMSVNLLLPDSLLVEQFLESVATLRKMSSVDPPPKSTRPDFESWIKHGLLPYLDLRLWAFKEKVTISNRAMAGAIFRDGFGGEETVRKTTARIAEDMTSTSHRDFLNLRGQASQAADAALWFKQKGH
jgi:Family of unknown function (DUF6387)